MATRIHILPVEVDLIVMSQAPDLKALLNTAAAFPHVTPELEHRGDNLMPLFMLRFLPAELHRLRNAVSAWHTKVSANDPELDFDNPRKNLLSLQSRCCDVVKHELKYITLVKSATDSFACGFVALECHPPLKQDDPGKDCWPVNDSKYVVLLTANTLHYPRPISWMNSYLSGGIH